MSQSALPTRRFATIPKVAELNQCDPGTVYNRVKKGDLPVFKLPGKRGHYVDVDEAAKVLSKRQKYATFGPDAVVKDLSNVVADFEVMD
ncbi:MerR family transcriptional regulator [Nocardioides donggukensis]|uniref:DNA-binding protein n=1 Tax=Nocardioides donggukensis TaxID=2774019 RepID=A0A927Q3V2_9ACTN|nr:hypothetical protein [Nocardioides donggukensis]MBD8870931.1 hypothetical protein [Nocardioides donggukensis]